MNELQNRIMCNQSIANSFKGILRLSPITDGDKNDEFLEPQYYTNFSDEISKLNFADGSYNGTEKGLFGELNRYSGDDKFYNGKLPVTDSVGNYMNMNLGIDGTVFGSKEDRKNNNDFKNGCFPVIESNSIVIGLEKIKQNRSKETVFGGKLNIVAGIDTNNKPQIITENNICQSDIDAADPEYRKYSVISSTDKRNTIITPGNKSVNEYDAFVHNQEWNEKTENILSSTVKIRNLKDAVKERLEKYLQNSVVEMPIGSIIWQYISLAKWYGLSDTGDEIELCGNRPKMAFTGKESVDDSNYVFHSSRVAGISKEINRLLDNNSNSYMNDDGGTTTIDVKEIIPIYKRDYALCDGTIYSVPTCLYENRGDAVVKSSSYLLYERFKPLFSTIGYYYTSLNNIKKHYKYRLVNGKYSFWTFSEEGAPSGTTDGQHIVDDSETNVEILFGRDWCQMLAFYYIYKEILNGNFVKQDTSATFDRNAAEEWLKTKKLDKEDLFASPLPQGSNESQLYYMQTVSNAMGQSKTFKINIGTEVSSFGSMITLSSDGTRCEAWKLPEVQFILDLFDNAYGAGYLIPKYYPGKKVGDVVSLFEMNNMIKRFCVYNFQVPNFNINKDEKYKIGCFISSTATASFSPNDKFEPTFSNCYFTANELPHRHTLFVGWNHYGEKNPNCGLIPPRLSTIYKSSGRCSAYGIFKQSSNTPAQNCTDTVNNYVIQFNPNIFLSNEWNIDKSLNGDNIYYCKRMIDASHKTCEPDRGITSDQVNETMTNTAKLEMAKSANIIEGSAEYFAPESISMLPLIKL